MVRFNLTCFLLLLFSFPLFAQVHPDSLVYKNVTWDMLEGRGYHLDVNGVAIGTKLSQQQFIALFGEPDQIFNQEEVDDDGLGAEVGFRYGKNGFETLDQVFWEFHIYDSCYKVLTKYFDGGVSVGDHISIFKGFQSGVLYQRNPKRWGENSYELLNGSDGFYLRFYTDDDGYIEYMYYVEPV